MKAHTTATGPEPEASPPADQAPAAPKQESELDALGNDALRDVLAAAPEVDEELDDDFPTLTAAGFEVESSPTTTTPGQSLVGGDGATLAGGDEDSELELEPVVVPLDRAAKARRPGQALVAKVDAWNKKWGAYKTLADFKAARKQARVEVNRASNELDALKHGENVDHVAWITQRTQATWNTLDALSTEARLELRATAQKKNGTHDATVVSAIRRAIATKKPDLVKKAKALLSAGAEVSDSRIFVAAMSLSRLVDDNSAANQGDFDRQLQDVKDFADLIFVQKEMNRNGGKDLTGKQAAVSRKFNAWNAKHGSYFHGLVKQLVAFGYSVDANTYPVLTTIRKGKRVVNSKVPFTDVNTTLEELLKKARTQDPQTYWKETVLTDQAAVKALSQNSATMVALCTAWAHGNLKSDEYADLATINKYRGEGDMDKVQWDHFDTMIRRYTLLDIQNGSDPKTAAGTLGSVTYKSINDGVLYLRANSASGYIRDVRKHLDGLPKPSVAGFFKLGS